MVGRHTWKPHLPFSSKDDLNKKFWENIHFDIGWGYAMVWTGWSSIIPKHLFRQEAVILFFLFFKSSLKKIASAASVPPKSSDDHWLPFCLYHHSTVFTGSSGSLCGCEGGLEQPSAGEGQCWRRPLLEKASAGEGQCWRRPVLPAGMFCRSWSSLGLHSVEAPFIFRHCFSFNCFKMV